MSWIDEDVVKVKFFTQNSEYIRLEAADLVTAICSSPTETSVENWLASPIFTRESKFGVASQAMMDDSQQDVPVPTSSVTVDLIDREQGYEFRTGVREKSRLRGMLMDLASFVDAGPLTRGNLVLVDPKVTSETIADVATEASRIFHPELVERLSLIEVRLAAGGEVTLQCYPDDRSEKELARIREIVRNRTEEASTARRASVPGNSFYEVLRVLMARWLNPGLLPITISQLGDETGYSYKPVRKALDELSRHLEQYGHSGVELKSFPREAWSRLFLDADSIRETIRFWPEGEMPRTPASMLERFFQLPKKETGHVGIGGAEGARYHAPDLDLIGQPRLDFTVHCPTGDPDLGFLRKLDASLKPTEKREDACSVVVHLLRRPRDYFDDRFADPGECLLDLQEMRLDAQARAFLRSFAVAENDDF